MHDKIRSHVLGLLAQAPDCPEKTEVADEMVANLIEKYDDLVAQGRDPDDAYREVVAGIGDVSEIITLIRGASSCRQNDERTAPDAPFAGFEERVRNWSEQLSRSIEEPVRNMANELKSAAKQMQSSAQKSSRGFRYDYTLEADGIDSLIIAMKSGDLRISPSRDSHIHVTERSRADLRDDQRISFEQNENCLRISQGRNYVGFFMFGFGVINSDLDIELPPRLWQSITATGVMDTDIEDLKCRTLGIKSTSGDINIQAIESESLTLESISGDIDISGNVDTLDIHTKSGDVDLRNMVVESLFLDKISGDCTFAGSLLSAAIKSKSGDTRIQTHTLPHNFSIDSVSGDIRLALPENDGFSIQYKRVSGSFKSDFNLMTSLNSRNGTAVYKGGSETPYTISAISGDIHVVRIG